MLLNRWCQLTASLPILPLHLYGQETAIDPTNQPMAEPMKTNPREHLLLALLLTLVLPLGLKAKEITLLNASYLTSIALSGVSGALLGIRGTFVAGGLVALVGVLLAMPLLASRRNPADGNIELAGEAGEAGPST